MTLGLSTLRDLILYRPPYRNTALNILLEYTAHNGIHTIHVNNDR